MIAETADFSPRLWPGEGKNWPSNSGLVTKAKRTFFSYLIIIVYEFCRTRRS